MATTDIQIVDYSATQLKLTITDDGGGVEESYIKKTHFSTNVDGDNVIIWWYERIPDRDVKSSVMDFNLVSDPASISALDLQTKIINMNGVAWGSITGTLSNQTDLQTELDTLFAIAVAL